jgi:hypothetical protein
MAKRNRASGTADPAIDPGSIPVTIPAAALEAIGEGYEFVETLEFPQAGSGGTYNAGVFEGVLEALKTRPIPGDKRGHQENPNDDFFVIGGKIEGNRILFRVRVPETGYDGESNEGFIRSLKTGNQKMSLVLDVDDDGSGHYDKLRSDMGLRNDAVGTLPAMRSQEIHANKERELLALVKRGKICESESAELIVNGQVNLIAVKNIKPLDNPVRNRILNAAKNKPVRREKTREEKNGMDREEVLALLKETLPEFMKAFTEQQNKEKNEKKNAADIEGARKVLDLAREALGEEAADLDAEDVFKQLVELLKSAEDAAAETEANKFVGPNLRKNKDGKDTPLFDHARKEFKSLGHNVFRRKNCEKKHEEMRNSDVLKALRRAELNPVVTNSSEFDSDGTF